MTVGQDQLDPIETSTTRRVVVLGVLFVIVFATLLAIAFPDGRETVFRGVPATANADEVVPYLGVDDAGRYVGFGRELSLGNRANTHFFNHWPPGMPVFNAILFRVFGPNMPVALTIAIVAAAVWAAVLTAWLDLLSRLFSVAIAAVIVAAVVLSSVMAWLFGPGVLMSEGYFTACLLGALYAATRAALTEIDARRLGWASGVGLMLALAAYFRATGELIGRTLTYLVVAWFAFVLAAWLFRLVRDREKPSLALVLKSRNLRALLVCVLAFQVLTVPWRIVAAQTVRPGNYAWVTVIDRYWHMQWVPDRVFANPPPGFIYRYGTIFIAGETNPACKVDPRTCRTIARHELQTTRPYQGIGKYTEAKYHSLAVQALEREPVQWMTRRAALLPDAWFAAAAPCAANNSFSTCRPPSGIAAPGHELVENALFLLALIGSLALSAIRVRRSGLDLVALLVPAVLVSTLAPLVFLGYEVRFFFPLEIAQRVRVRSPSRPPPPCSALRGPRVAARRSSVTPDLRRRPGSDRRRSPATCVRSFATSAGTRSGAGTARSRPCRRFRAVRWASRTPPSGRGRSPPASRTQPRCMTA